MTRTPHRKPRRVPAAAIICMILMAGCDSKPYGLVPVSGIVTLDGNPLPGAQVSFQPQGQTTNPGPGSAGVCDSTGRYELKTIRNEPGAVPGPHAVRIYGPRGDVDSSSDEDAPGRKELIPRRYNFDTELTVNVPEGGTIAADFALTTK